MCQQGPRRLRPETDGDSCTTITPQIVGLMHWSTRLHLFLYLLRFTQTTPALSLHQTENFIDDVSPTLIATQTLNETSKSENVVYLCSEDPSVRNRPSGSDCIRIINLLLPSNSDDPHAFHRDGAQDDQDLYLLPYLERYETCEIEVDLIVGFTSETSSWLVIAAKARELIQRCVFAGPALGGMVRIGSLGGISITVLGNVREELEGNITTS